MQTIDFFIAIPVVWGIIKGFKRGLISELSQLAALVLGCILASKFSHFVSNILITHFHLSEKIVPVVSFILIFSAVLIGIFFLSKAMTNLVKAIALGWLNRGGGMVFGGIKFLLVIGIMLQIIITYDVNQRLITPEIKKQSVLLRPTLKITNFFTPYLKKALFESEAVFPKDDDTDHADDI